MKNTVTQNTKRGRIVTGDLTKSILFNSAVITKAVIEIDHINYGLNKKTGELNKKSRTNFTINDIEKFLMRLDGEDILAIGHRKRVSKFDFRVDCPVPGRFYKRQFIMIFDTDYDKPGEIYTITLVPGW